MPLLTTGETPASGPRARGIRSDSLAIMLMNTPHFYRLSRPDTPWGDYGDVLIHGMASRSDSGELEIERTGPFIPPITQPTGSVVVTAQFLKQLSIAGFKGIVVGPVHKKRIVLIDWHLWEPFGPNQGEYPDDCEPESYIWNGKHSVKAAATLGELFELSFGLGARVSREGGFHLVGSSWDGSDFFRAESAPGVYLSQRARDWLSHNASEWVSFEEEQVL